MPPVWAIRSGWAAKPWSSLSTTANEQGYAHAMPRVWLVAIAGTLTVQLAAQQQPPPPATTAPPVFRSAARLVQINVVVHGRDGQPVADLKKEDFTVLERGKPQRIAFFSIDNADATAAAPAATPLPSDVFTNALPQSGGAGSVTIVLLDLVNTGWEDQHAARDALLKFLQQIEPRDHIAIFTLGRRGLTLLHDYTTDASSLVAHLKDARGELSAALDASTLDNASQQELRDMGLDDLADANQREADFFTTDRVVNTLATFQAIAEHLSGLPGRKNLIWLSGGVPLMIGYDEMPEAGGTFNTRDHRIFSPEMDAAVRALNNSGVAIYPVDARRLMPPAGFSASARAPLRTPPSLARTNANLDTMLELADRTGGRAAYNSNDLARAIRRAVDDSRVTYTIGYYPADDTQDGKFRDVKVTVDRPHLDVRFRKGYFALRPAVQTAAARRREMRAAVWSPLDSTQLPIGARVDFLDEPPDTINEFVQLDPATLSFRKDGDRWKATIDMAYVQKDAHGAQTGEGEVDTMALALTEENYRRLMQQGFIRQHRSPRAAGAAFLRIVVRDGDSGAVGSVTVPLDKVPTAHRTGRGEIQDRRPRTWDPFPPFRHELVVVPPETRIDCDMSVERRGVTEQRFHDTQPRQRLAHDRGLRGRVRCVIPRAARQCVVSATARAISDLTPGTMLLACAYSSSRCGSNSATAPIATAGMPMAIALFASVDPTSAAAMARVPG
jgi:VWFA-related protein